MLRPAALCAVSAVAFALAAPPVGLWPLAFVCLAPMAVSLRGQGAAARFGLGFATGCLTASLTVVAPLGSAFAGFFGVGGWLGVPAAALVSFVFAGFGFGVCGWLAGGRSSSAPLQVARFGVAWVAGDLLRTHALTGLPWLLLGHLVAPVPALCQLASVGGTALVSFWLAAVSAWIAATATRGLSRESLSTAALLLSIGVFGAWLEPSLDSGPGSVHLLHDRASGAAQDVAAAQPGGHALSATRPFRLALVQPAAPGRGRVSLGEIDAVFERLARESRAALPADLIVWPENAIPLPLPANLARVQELLRGLPEPPRFLLLGAPYAEGGAPSLSNAALLLDARGNALGAHEKVHRVPFTEYAPWPFEGLWHASLQIAAGERPRTVVAEGISLGPLICYELLFPALARAQVAQGANVLVNLSHDGWFGGLAGARQHATAAVLRAVELRRPLLRATSDGITLAVDAGGRIAGELEARRAGVLRLRVVGGEGRTLYARFGDTWARCAVLLVLLLTAREQWVQHRNEQARP